MELFFFFIGGLCIRVVPGGCVGGRAAKDLYRWVLGWSGILALPLGCIPVGHCSFCSCIPISFAIAVFFFYSGTRGITMLKL